MIYAPPSVFCPKGDPALKSIPPSSSVPRETLPSGVAPFIFYPERDPTLHPPVSPSAQHPLYQSSREGKNALT